MIQRYLQHPSPIVHEQSKAHLDGLYGVICPHRHMVPRHCFIPKHHIQSCFLTFLHILSNNDRVYHPALTVG